jgi:hypothetical protein
MRREIRSRVGRVGVSVGARNVSGHIHQLRLLDGEGG